MVLVHILLLTSLAAIDGHTASCTVRDTSVISHSSAGLAQVSNLALIEVECNVPARPFPTRPGESRNGLRAVATAYQVGPDDVRKEVPSETNDRGGGQNGFGAPEFVWFTITLPLDPADRMLEAQRWISKLQETAMQDTNLSRQQVTETLLHDLSSPQSMEKLSQEISQHRAGHFRVECRVLDGDRVVGVGTLEFEVLFKGRFSDRPGPLGYWQTQPPK
jgi:hypothetical protein